MSCIIVWEEKEGDKRKFPLGERAKEVGVSVWPVREYTCSPLRKSYTYEGLATRKEVSGGAYVYLIVERANIEIGAIGPPAHGCDWTSYFERRYSSFGTVFASLPDFHRSVIGASSDKLGPCASCHCAVNTVDDLTVSANFPHALAGSDVCQTKSMVCRDGVKNGGEEGPLKI